MQTVAAAHDETELKSKLLKYAATTNAECVVNDSSSSSSPIDVKLCIMTTSVWMKMATQVLPSRVAARR